jgi:hypothetical protein
MGNKYAPVAVENVQILFQPPPWPYEQIGIVTSLGAQVASDATVYRELQNQATQLGADAVLIISAGTSPCLEVDTSPPTAGVRADLL